ncbi:replication protein C [Pseudooceanicola sp. 216_PA32_1]|uniref:Replication protein C n=1 Tax=Pseudooceanicola pacificus TaxID=2676438 RepID=A0A844WEX7_9RHOB|nr:helix-turn-helix domain-containing protein [Pseudooceanicola pacificus]MWB78730.1 replication protein C [Pseudooceanicola pacificus]
MNLEQVAAVTVGAQDTCAEPHPLPFAGMGTIEVQPHFAPVTRRALMAAVNTVARDLGLRAASVVVMDALLSCLPCKDPKSGAEAPITPATLLTVFAANETLCFRAKGITDRQLRRHLERLEEVGLIRRRDSANGKRFPLQRGGRIVGAYGIDLSPLLERAQALLQMAERRRQEQAELRGLKARILRLRADCLALARDPRMLETLDAARNAVRRVGLTLATARDLIRSLGALLADMTAGSAPDTPGAEHAGTDQLPASDGQNVRHEEPENPDTKKTATHPISWSALNTVPAFFPDPPRTEQGLLRLIYDFGAMLGIQPPALSQVVSTIGPMPALVAMDGIAMKIEQVENPGRYLAGIAAKARFASVGRGPQAVPG